MTSLAATELGDDLWGRVRPGRGARVLWIHGYTLDSSIWEELWQLLPDAEHIGVDLPGHGASPPRERENLQGVSARIARLAERTGAHHLIAVSFGGLVALEVAAELGESLKSLTLSSPQVPGAPLDPSAQTRNLELLRLFQERGPGSWLTDSWMRAPPEIFSGAARVPPLWQRLRSVVDRHAWTELGSQSLRWIGGPQTTTSLARISAHHVQVYVGESDIPAFKRGAEMLKRKVPHCRRSYVPDAGHLAILERPLLLAPELARIVADAAAE